MEGPSLARELLEIGAFRIHGSFKQGPGAVELLGAGHELAFNIGDHLDDLPREEGSDALKRVAACATLYGQG